MGMDLFGHLGKHLLQRKARKQNLQVSAKLEEN